VAACFIITFSASARLIMRSGPDEPFDLAGFVLLTGIYTAFAIAIIAMYMLEIRKTLRMLIDGLLALYSGARTRMHQMIPIISYDETGRLTDAFNVLQDRVARNYEEMDRQLN